MDKREEPDRADTQFLEIIELLDQAAKIADAICVAIVKRLHVQLVNDGVLEPKRVRHDLKLFARGRARRNAELWAIPLDALLISHESGGLTGLFHRIGKAAFHTSKVRKH
jgi:hypothetical protein